MKLGRKSIAIVSAGCVAVCVAAGAQASSWDSGDGHDHGWHRHHRPPPKQPELGSRTAPILTIGKLKFKDLNRNGTLDPTRTGAAPPANEGLIWWAA
jgi:hypothetical protein